MKLLIYGCGRNCRRFIENGCINLDDIVGFVDQNAGGEFYQKKVFRIGEAKDLLETVDYILVTIQEYDANKQIYHDMTECAYPMNKVVFIYNRCVEFLEHRIHEQDDLVLRKISMQIYESEVCVRNAQIQSTACLYDPIDHKKMIGTSQLTYDDIYMRDYCRYRAFELAASEIESKCSVTGSCAEAGVFQGVFATLINARFPDRKLYLYDTFESFRKEEYEKELFEGNAPKGFFQGFADTSVDRVISSMCHPENCIIRKGFFPESIMEEDMDEQFFFVSLDMDFEDSTLDGLKFFYPRLVKGGYIFVHDYHNHCFSGVGKAVERFEKNFDIRLMRFPLPDEGGTLVITK